MCAKGEKDERGKQKKGTETNETKPHQKTPRKTSPRLSVYAVCAPKFATGSNEPLNKLWSQRPSCGLPEDCLLLTAAVTSWLPEACLLVLNNSASLGKQL